MPPKPASENQQRDRHVISFSLTPETVWLITALSPRYANNRSAVVNDAIRELAAAAGIVYVPPTPQVQPMILQLVQNGIPLRTLYHQGKTYVVAPESGAYAIRLTNPGPGRREFVLSVDGIDVLDGEPASPTKRGYVLGAGQNADITGWRRTADTVAAFEFSATGGSYAEKTGRGANKGVIAVAVYAERVHRTNTVLRSATKSVFLGGGDGVRAMYSCSIGNGLEPMVKTSGGLNLGTAYGAETTMRTSTTTFTRDNSAPMVTLELYYATADALRAMGVPVDTVASTPNPWPGSGPSVPPPAGWTP